MNAATFSTRYVTLSAGFDRPTHGVDRALVLGGGGAAGNAWLIGVVAGLLDAGLDVTEADLVIGTSAGSTAAAQITSASPAQLLAGVLEATPPQPRAASPSAGVRAQKAPVAPAVAVVDHQRRTADIIAASQGPIDMRIRLGAAAVELAESSDRERQAQWRATVAARLPSQQWPQPPVLVTAVDARSGEPVVFDRHSGVDLVDAVAASTSSGAAYGIGGDWYVDGGYRRSSENADLAAGYGRVLVLSPLGGRTRAPLEWGMQLAVQLDELRAGGSRAEAILPDHTSLAAFGSNLMDLTARAPAARAGYEQGRAIAGQLADFWR
jgi:NTE family protein